MGIFLSTSISTCFAVAAALLVFYELGIRRLAPMCIAQTTRIRVTGVQRGLFYAGVITLVVVSVVAGPRHRREPPVPLPYDRAHGAGAHRSAAVARWDSMVADASARHCRSCRWSNSSQGR